MWERERGNYPRESEGDRMWKFKVSSHTEKIIIPQTIRSVIRIYLLWRGSINREDKKIKQGERQKNTLSPRDAF